MKSGNKIKNLDDKIKSLNLTMTKRDESKQVIMNFCKALQNHIFRERDNPAGEFFLETGFTTIHGLEYKVIVRVPKRNYQDVFFRFYVPIDGYPVMLDLWDENLTPCGNMQAIERNLSKFLDNEDVLSRLKGYAEIAN